MEKKKILIASDSFLPKIDGVSVFLKRIIPRFSKEFKLSLVAPGFKGRYEPVGRIKIYKTRISPIRIANYNIPLPSRKLIRRLVKNHDIVFIQDIGPICYYTLKYAKKYNKKVIAYVHTIEGQRFAECSEATSKLKSLFRFVTNKYERWFYNSCDKLIVSSNSISKILYKEGITTKYDFIPLGVDIEKFKPSKNKKLAKAKLGIKKDTFVIGYLGRISKEKDLKTLRDAFEEIPIDNKLLLIVGGGSFLQTRIFKDMKNKRITGFISKPIRYLQAMDVYVLPSLTETSSLSTLEAMSSGLPIIATPVGSVSDYIHNQKNGLIFDKKDVKGLVYLLLRLYKDEKLREELGKNARETAKEFTWNQTVDTLIKFFKEI